MFGSQLLNVSAVYEPDLCGLPIYMGRTQTVCFDSGLLWLVIFILNHSQFVSEWPLVISTRANWHIYAVIGILVTPRNTYNIAINNLLYYANKTLKKYFNLNLEI